MHADDSTCDLPIDPSNEEQYIVWGVGGVGETAFKHFERANGESGPKHNNYMYVCSLVIAWICLKGSWSLQEWPAAIITYTWNLPSGYPSLSPQENFSLGSLEKGSVQVVLLSLGREAWPVPGAPSVNVLTC